jgi:hypothetical protein
MIAAGVIGLAVTAGALALAGGADRPGAEPAPSASASATPAPSPSPPTAEQQAEADLEQLVRDYYAQMNELYADPAMPLEELNRYTSGQLLQLRLLLHSQFRTSGARISGGPGIQPREIEIASMDLAIAPPSAKITVCSGGSLAGFGADGSAESFDQELTSFTYEANYVAVDGVTSWRLMTSEVGDLC